MFAEMAKEATDVVQARRRLGAEIRITRSADMRYAGQGHEILVDLPDGPFTKASVAELQQALRGGLSRAVQPRRFPPVDIEVTGWILKRGGAGAGPRRRSCGPPAAGPLVSRSRRPRSMRPQPVRSDAARAHVASRSTSARR